MQQTVGQRLDPEKDFYRGGVYHFNSDNQIWWRPIKEAYQGGLKATVTSRHHKLLKLLRQLKPDGGSFRVTENNAVLTKIPNEGIKDHGEEWEAVYVCELDRPFTFKEDIDPAPSHLEPGDIWPSFYDGAKYSAVRDGRGTRMWFRNNHYRNYVEHDPALGGVMPVAIEKEFAYYKGQGGSLRVTENGYVITLISPQPLSDDLRRQWEKLSVTQQRLVELKVEGTRMLPIYLGQWVNPAVKLKPRKDYSIKLSKEDRTKMLRFLNKFTKSEDDIDEPFYDDPEDFFGDPEDY